MDFARARRIMVDSQVRVNDVTDPNIVRAFLTVPREAFVPKSMVSTAYSEAEMSVAEGRALWTPRDLGKMLRALDPQAEDVALVIGAATGYSAALLAQMVETVIALEDEAGLVDAMTQTFAELDYDRAVAVEGPLAQGLPGEGPFALILVGGMVETVPQAWLDQLADGGRLGVVVRTGRNIGEARVYTRAGTVVSHRDAFECCPPVLPGFEAPKAFVF